MAGAKLRDEDYVTHIIPTTAHAYLLFFSNRGRVYRLKAHEIPMKDRTARGTAIVNLLPLQPGETIQAIIDTRDYETNRFLFFATKKGQVKKTKFTEYDSSLRAGLIAINLRDGDELVQVIPTNGGDDIFMVSRSGMTIRFTEDEVRAMGRAAAGVRGMKMKPERRGRVVRRRPRRRRHPHRHRRAATASAPSSTSSTARAAAARACGASSSPPRRASWSPRSWSASTTRSS